MSRQDQQISIRFIASYVAGIACYLAITQYLFAKPAMIMGLIFFLLTYIIAFILLTRPPQLNSALQKANGPGLSLRWRLMGSFAAAIVSSFIVMMCTWGR